MKRIILAASLLLSTMVATAEKPTAPEQLEGVNRLDADATAELILKRPELVIIDARKYEEYAKGHIEGAINLIDTGMDQASLASHVEDKQSPILFYCNGARCLRSSNAAAKAQEWGYQNIYWFRGGWVEWTNQGLPVSR